VAEEPEHRRRDAGQPRGRAEWFGRALGSEWVEVEPGIYEHRPAISESEGPATPTTSRETPLDEELLESLPRAPEEPARKNPEFYKFQT
jgi:hypothetical protein